MTNVGTRAKRAVEIMVWERVRVWSFANWTLVIVRLHPEPLHLGPQILGRLPHVGGGLVEVLE